MGVCSVNPCLKQSFFECLGCAASSRGQYAEAQSASRLFRCDTVGGQAWDRPLSVAQGPRSVPPAHPLCDLLATWEEPPRRPHPEEQTHPCVVTAPSKHPGDSGWAMRVCLRLTESFLQRVRDGDHPGGPG